MAITRRRVFDGVAAFAGVLVMLLALVVFDQGTRHSSGAELSSVGESVNYLAIAITLMVAQVVRGEITEHLQLLVFIVTAAVLVVLLMRM